MYILSSSCKGFLYIAENITCYCDGGFSSPVSFVTNVEVHFLTEWIKFSL